MTDEPPSAAAPGRAFRVAANVPWAMTEEYVRLVLRVAGRFVEEGGNLPDTGALRSGWGRSPEEAVAAGAGEPLDGARRVFVREGGVAVVPVLGPIFRRANLLTDVSGATSLETLARDFQLAMDSPDVRSVIFDVDSPGGEANGISEMSDLIYDARSRKPVRAFVGGMAASGAFWLASAAEEIVASDTAIMGSVGVRAAFTDTRERDRRRGVRRVEVVSSQTPKKSLDPFEDDDDRAEVQRIVDSLADVFVSDLARNRGVSRETVLEDFGGGRVFVGEENVRRGMADRVGTFESLLAETQQRPETAGCGGPEVRWAASAEGPGGRAASATRARAGDVRQSDGRREQGTAGGPAAGSSPEEEAERGAEAARFILAAGRPGRRRVAGREEAADDGPSVRVDAEAERAARFILRAGKGDGDDADRGAGSEAPERDDADVRAYEAIINAGH